MSYKAQRVIDCSIKKLWSKAILGEQEGLTTLIPNMRRVALKRCKELRFQGTIPCNIIVTPVLQTLGCVMDSCRVWSDGRVERTEDSRDCKAVMCWMIILSLKRSSAFFYGSSFADARCLMPYLKYRTAQTEVNRNSYEANIISTRIETLLMASSIEQTFSWARLLVEQPPMWINCRVVVIV